MKIAPILFVMALWAGSAQAADLTVSVRGPDGKPIPDAVVTVYPNRTEVAETTLAGHAPGCMAVTETNPSYLMIANPDDNAITVFDVDNGKLTALVQVGAEPRRIARLRCPASTTSAGVAADRHSAGVAPLPFGTPLRGCATSERRKLFRD